MDRDDLRALNLVGESGKTGSKALVKLDVDGSSVTTASTDMSFDGDTVLERVSLLNDWIGESSFSNTSSSASLMGVLGLELSPSSSSSSITGRLTSPADSLPNNDLSSMALLKLASNAVLARLLSSSITSSASSYTVSFLSSPSSDDSERFSKRSSTFLATFGLVGSVSYK